MSTHLEKSDEYYFCCRIFVAALLREVARRSRDRGSFSLMRLYSLSQLRWQLPIGGAHYHFRRQRLAAARSRHGSDSPPDCHSLPCRHFATLKGRWVEFLLPLGRCGHRPLQFVRFLHITVGCDAHIAPWKFRYKFTSCAEFNLPNLQECQVKFLCRSCRLDKLSRIV